MGDIVDRANDEAENILRNQIRASKKIVKQTNPTGFCYYCDEAIAGNKVFCNTDCSSDHEREEKQRLRSGCI